VVKSFWIEDLMDNTSEGKCGFVHEEGRSHGLNKGGNHIHLPVDTKI
jgi:hypothetical protein